ncbi:MAG: multicopper oxidase domain-containing protein [Candidatus Tectomicrobia bacterium]|uniref:Multicopper oxidase domain-containing protein n=1 Tax=Tectimicrobiota bacterium TaxID=2528274 RepID=A0A932CNR3_UNCTE|nr:multicopper oxidase domain-containing protein [Candidatus Tectomicrobia bacterium]
MSPKARRDRAVFCFLLATLLLLPCGSALAEVRELTLTVTEGTLELDGTKFMVWTYNGKVPGPEIRVKEGDTVRIKLRNPSGARHGLFFHGLHVSPRVALQEEVAVDPGYEYTYEFVAKPAGTHLYHCSWNMAEHLSRGLYGVLIVEAQDEPKFDQELVYLLSDWNSQAATGAGHHEMGHPRTMAGTDITTLNERVIAAGNPTIVQAGRGERVRIRLAGIGHLPHTLRSDEGFLVTHEDGYPIYQPRKERSLTLYPGKRYDIVVTLDRSGRVPFYHSITLPQPFSRRASLQEGHDHDRHDPAAHPPAPENIAFVLEVKEKQAKNRQEEKRP